MSLKTLHPDLPRIAFEQSALYFRTIAIMINFKDLSRTIPARTTPGFSKLELVLPLEMQLSAHDSNADTRYFVFPQPLADLGAWVRSSLEAAIIRDPLIGVCRAAL
ncbi:MAG: hypothetical protein ABJQ70_10480 [Roseobacter sp.]